MKTKLHSPRIRLDICAGRPHEQYEDRYQLSLRTPGNQLREVQLSEDELLELVFQAMQARDLKRIRARNRNSQSRGVINP